MVAYDPAHDRMIDFGGVNSSAFLGDTWAYDPVANTWTQLHPSGLLPSVRWGQSMVYDTLSSQVIMFGGGMSYSSSQLLNDTWAYDPAANTWTKLNPAGPLPPARAGHEMTYDAANGRVIVFGGARSWEISGIFNDTWAYDPVANTWTDLSPSGTLPLPVGTRRWCTTPQEIGRSCSQGVQAKMLPSTRPGPTTRKLAPNLEMQAIGSYLRRHSVRWGDNPDTPLSPYNPVAYTENGLRAFFRSRCGRGPSRALQRSVRGPTRGFLTWFPRDDSLLWSIRRHHHLSGDVSLQGVRPRQGQGDWAVLAPRSVKSFAPDADG